MAKIKYYAVKVGKTPGVYTDWATCSEMVQGYPGAIYKGFATIEEAEAFVVTKTPAKTSSETPAQMTLDELCQEMAAQSYSKKEKKKDSTVKPDANETYAFVDGSYNIATNVYGYGGFLVHEGKEYVLTGSGSDEEMASMNNVAGEILGSMAAINKAIELGIKKLSIYYDYEGIKMWATGQWKRNKAGTIAYYEFVNSTKGKIELNFVKVKGHSGVEGNERADKLAKQAVGIE